MTEQRVIARDEAKAAGLVHYFTGKPCRYGHVAKRLVSNWGCMVCSCEKVKRRYAADPVEKAKKRERDSKRGEYFASYRAAKREHYREIIAKWREENRERQRELGRAWRQKNKHKKAEEAMRRYVVRVEQTPAWAERKAIEQVYALSAFMTESTGIQHHVDHIVPLRGKTVCGLHVAANLQVLLARDNLVKNRHYWPDMWEEVA